MDTQFIYETYIATTPEKLWEALTNPECTAAYWGGDRLESDWRYGSKVRLLHGTNVRDEGEVLECIPATRLSYSWVMLHSPGLKAEGASRVTCELQRLGSQVRLRVIHDGFQPGSQVLALVSRGWPVVLSGLKTLLETGTALDADRHEAQPIQQ